MRQSVRIRVLISIGLAAISLQARVCAQQNQDRPFAANRAVSAEQAIANWKQKPQEVARQMIAKYGQPQEVTEQRLIWHKNGPWKRTELVNEEIPHEFPKSHKDMLLQTIDYKVSPEKYDELAKYDGSVVAERTKGELSARCDKEEANFLAINLAHEIATGKKSVEAARRHYAEAMIEMKHSNYKQGFLFDVPQVAQGDPDQPFLIKGDKPDAAGTAGRGEIQRGAGRDAPKQGKEKP